MLLFRQTSRCVLQKVTKKDHISLMPKLQDLPFIYGRTIFASPYYSAEGADPKANEPGSSTWCSRKTDEEKRVERTGRGTILPKPFSLFSAGAAKKRAKIFGEEEQPFISTKDAVHCLPPEKPLSLEEWEELKGEYDGHQEFEEFMMRQINDYNRPIDVAKSLLAAVAKRDGDIGYNILMQYLKLCVSQNQTEEIYDICDIIRTRFKTLEKTAATLLIRGLSHSPRWRDALAVLEQSKKQKIMTPTNRNYRDCIHGALMNQEIDTAFNLFHDLLAEGITPTLDTLKLFFDSGKDMQDDHLKNKLIYMLKYLRDNQIYPEESLMESIKEWFESIPGENWKGTITTIKKSGHCSSCNQLLENINLSPEEYNLLKEKILKDVIQGSDTFRKTTPKELGEFQRFVHNHPPFDIVIDGLNVAKINSKEIPSATLLGVVSYLALRNQRLLVLGRKHMLKGTSQWRRQDMAALSKMATLFMTENVSEDDPFLLYATLHSGNHCKFITRDLLRDHKACVSDSLIKRLFFKWQRGHQMVLSTYVPRKKICFEHVLSHDTIVQTTGNSWHIPYDDHLTERMSYEVPTKWLCLQQK